jgi:3-oxoacyl-[acyl-carrier protein] reductase
MSKKRHVLITGANGGIGRELVTLFLANHWEVIATHRSDPGVLTEIEKTANGHLHLFTLDLTSEKSVDALYSTLKQNQMIPDTVIANAGKYRSRSTPLHEMTLTEWRETLDDNLTSTFLTVRGFFRAIAESKPTLPPSLVLIGSTAGIYGEANHSDYAAAKSALQYGWMKSLKNEIVRLHPLGRVNVVAPGWTITAMAKDALSNRPAVERTLQTIALRKFGQPKDVAEAALFLADPERSGHISGHLLEMSGGMEGRVVHLPSDLKGFPS